MSQSKVASQPFSNAAGNALVFNGEIYNYRELAEKYQIVTDKDGGDTAVLFSLLCRFGVKF